MTVGTTRQLTQKEIRAVMARVVVLEQLYNKPALVKMWLETFPNNTPKAHPRYWKKEELARDIAEHELGVHWTQLPVVSRETTEITES